ncbi:ankyrin repeat-containing domain protein [Aspergillus falconensis]
MATFQSLPQELADIIVELFLEGYKPRPRSSSNPGHEILGLRRLCRIFYAAIENVLPHIDKFQLDTEGNHSPVTRLHLFRAVRKSSVDAHSLAAAIRWTSERILCSSGTEDGGEHEIQVMRSVCRSVAEAVRSPVFLRNPSAALVWDMERNLHLQSDKEKEELYRMAALTVTASEGNVQLLRSLLKEGPYTGQRLAAERVFEPLLLTAARSGREHIVKALVDDGFDCRHWDRDTGGNTVLHCAAMSGNAALFVFCLGQFALDPSETNNRGMTAISLAAGTGQTAIVEEACRRYNEYPWLLLHRFSDRVVHGSEMVRDMVHAAAANGQTAVLEYLLNYAEDIGRNSQQNPVRAAASNGHFDCARLLMSPRVIKDSAVFSQSAWLGLLESARNGYAGMFDYFMALGCVSERLQEGTREYLLALILANRQYNQFRRAVDHTAFKGGFDCRLIVTTLARTRWVQTEDSGIMADLIKGDIPRTSETVSWDMALRRVKATLPKVVLVLREHGLSE